MKSIRLLPDFGKPCWILTNPFFARFVPQHSLRNSLEGQDQAPEPTMAKVPTRSELWDAPTDPL